MSQRRRVATLTVVLYLATLSLDAIRKVTGLPAVILGVVYVITALIYVIAIPGTSGWKRETPRRSKATTSPSSRSVSFLSALTASATLAK